VVYDGLILFFIMLAQAYPIERAVIGLSLFNPVDLSRILVLMQLDAAALMGYTGALFRTFLGSGLGVAVSVTVLAVWVFVPTLLAGRSFRLKNF